MGGLAVGEVRVDFARMHHAAFGNQFAYRLGLLPARRRPSLARVARMHQGLLGTRQEAMVDEEVFLQRQSRVTPLQVPGTLANHAVTQGQILGARRRPDWIGLHEPKPVDRPHQRGRLDQRPGNRVTAQMREGRRHRRMMPARVCNTGPNPSNAGRPPEPTPCTQSGFAAVLAASISGACMQDIQPADHGPGCGYRCIPMHSPHSIGRSFCSDHAVRDRVGIERLLAGCPLA